ncbi:hypothetical protein BGX24_010315 [Mortierella sp. AD032]|nr:hypothetical protein BGX24_010315 [Mortierella sp. AD032]
MRPPPTAPASTPPALPGIGGRPRSGSAPQRPVTTTIKAPIPLDLTALAGVSAGRVPPPPPINGGLR